MRRVFLLMTLLLWLVSCNEEVPNTCSMPESISIRELYTNSAIIIWDSAEEGASYEIQIGISGFTIGDGDIITTQDPAVGIGDLSSGTAYDLYVRTICSDQNVSPWSEVFTLATIADCTQIVSTNVTNITQTTALISWEISGNLPISYIIEFAEEGFTPGQGNIAETSVQNIPLMNLMAGIRYEYYLTSKCAGQNLGDRIGPFTFETLD